MNLLYAALFIGLTFITGVILLAVGLWSDTRRDG